MGRLLRCEPGAGEIGIFLFGVCLLTLAVGVSFLTGFISYRGADLTRTRLQAGLYRSAYIASEAGAWDGSQFVISPQGAANEFNAVFAVEEDLSPSWGPVTGGPVIDGPVTLDNLTVYQSSQIGQPLVCGKVGTVQTPGVLACVSVPVKVSVLGIGIYDETMQVEEFVSPPWWNTENNSWQ